ncbi:MAG: hypothetical protein Pg6A_20580 [Termitinemataceae bacterium]|nr:MAG: hypothetical protein Pg6A_20580 [Termitinemataceae bacterium]
MEPLVYIKRLCVKNAGLYALLFVFSALLFGCATAKHPFDIGSYKTVVSDFAFFPEGALFYGFADKTKNRVIFNTLFEPFTKTNSAAKYVFSKTKKASFALFTVEKGRNYLPCFAETPTLWERLLFILNTQTNGLKTTAVFGIQKKTDLRFP